MIRKARAGVEVSICSDASAAPVVCWLLACAGRPDVPSWFYSSWIYMGFSGFTPVTTQPPNSVPLQVPIKRLHDYKNIGTQVRFDLIICSSRGMS